ncbi:uncharacterized protein [Phaseolus vulgaris]|uniref:uncharacterized protein n=1 Tax=Phaseolus vulgaris TaxID=3885 RepID=UPI0035CBB7B0
MEMVDIPCIGRKYTWYRPNGKAKSRLDRFLTTFEWLQHWPGSKQFVLDRQISDHCALLLKSNMTDWGPKPFRRMKNEIKGIHCHISDKWVEEPNTVKELVKDFYKKKMSVVEDIGVRLDNVEFKELIDYDNMFLTDPFDDKEIKDAIWNCDSSKSPGLDEVTFSFIKKHWGLLEKDVMGAVKHFHSEGKIPKGFSEDGLQKGESGNLVREENDLSGKALW